MAVIEITAIIRTVIIMRTATVVETMAIMAGVFKVFKERSIIMVEEKIAIVIARIFKKSRATNFNKREK